MHACTYVHIHGTAPPGMLGMIGTQGCDWFLINMDIKLIQGILFS